MNKKISFLKQLGIVVFGFTVWHCAEEPIENDLSHLNLSVDTLTLRDISAAPYWVNPNLGNHPKLYLGEKNNRKIPVTFFKFPDHLFWDYYLDSSNTFDSLHFVLYSDDSVLTVESCPNLYFSPDSQFDELNTFSPDVESFSTAEWTDLSSPSVHINTDTLGIFTHTKIVWDLMSLASTLSDTIDSNLVRTFALNYVTEDSNFVEFYSREATSGSRDPQVNLFFKHETVVDDDSTRIDELNGTVYVSKDLSVIEPELSWTDSSDSEFTIDYGHGRRATMSLKFDSLVAGSIIRSANLFLNVDTTQGGNEAYVIIDPIESPLDTSLNIFETDPYDAIGYPFRVSSRVSDGQMIISLKNFLQNVSMGNEVNIGFKVISDVTNSPFEPIPFDLNNAKLEILYVSN